MEIASEFLVMAATLLQIKSRMLLPKPAPETDEEEADPRTMLVEMLIEYRRIKACAAKLTEMKTAAERYVYRRPLAEGRINRSIAQYQAGDLVKSLLALLAKACWRFWLPGTKPRLLLSVRSSACRKKWQKLSACLSAV